MNKYDNVNVDVLHLYNYCRSIHTSLPLSMSLYMYMHMYDLTSTS